MISEGQRLQYLEAMGIQAWVDRSRVVDKARAVPGGATEQWENTATEPKASPVQAEAGQSHSLAEAQYEIGPGSGQTLLLCDSREDSTLQIASDIARSLGEAPVWGWRLKDTESGGFQLDEAIRDRLFTRVLLFTDSAGSSTGQNEVKSSARVYHAPSIATLANSPQQKRALWVELARNGWCSSPS